MPPSICDSHSCVISSTFRGKSVTIALSFTPALLAVSHALTLDTACAGRAAAAYAGMIRLPKPPRTPCFNRLKRASVSGSAPIDTVTPPSTTTGWPVTQREASEARNSNALASSSGRPIRPGSAITDALVHGPRVAVDMLGQQRKAPVHEGVDVLGGAVGGQGAKAHHIGKQQVHLLVFTLQHTPRHQNFVDQMEKGVRARDGGHSRRTGPDQHLPTSSRVSRWASMSSVLRSLRKASARLKRHCKAP